jgi:peptidoglycan/xylan/chitin deacetylase (PgdA/CDA1 family)
MRLPAIDGLRLVAQRLRSRYVPSALILLYHRVAEVRPDPWSLCVTPDHFAAQMEILRQYARPMQLRQLPQALADGHLPRRSVVVTFDDGYADNLSLAKPLLERYEIPATVFLITGHIGQAREFWWDELERLLLQPGTLPEALALRINGRAYQWQLGEAAQYSAEEARHHQHWLAWGEGAPTPRHALYGALWKLLQRRPEGARRTVLDALLAWAGAEPVGRPTHRSLSLAETCSLAHGNLIEVGAHTVTHSALAALPVAAQRHEVERSKACLEEVLGQAITSFSYPYGQRCDYTPATVAIVQQAGFACACSNFAGVVGRGTDRFQLPRVNVQDCDGETFARQLSSWFGGYE